MHLLLVISSFGGGGAERVLARLAEAWIASGVLVTLATFDGRTGDFYTLSGSIQRRSLRDETGSRRSLWPGPVVRALWLRSVIRESRPDAVISFTDRTCVVTLIASLGLKTPVIASERTDPEMYSPGRIWELLRRMIYPSAAAIVVQTEKVCGWSKRLFPRARTRVIPNPVPSDVVRVAGPSRATILAVGRLGPEKGFDSLLVAFSKIASRHPSWTLRILGEGPERPRLEQLASELGLRDRVEMPGRRHDVMQQLSEAGVFVLASRFEGFPNALVEAMASGLAVVSTDCASGPSELIEQGRNGILVPVDDADALASALERLLLDPDLRSRLGQSALHLRDRLSMGAVLQMWNDLLVECGCQLPVPNVRVEAQAA